MRVIGLAKWFSNLYIEPSFIKYLLNILKSSLKESAPDNSPPQNPNVFLGTVFGKKGIPCLSISSLLSYNK